MALTRWALLAPLLLALPAAVPNPVVRVDIYTDQNPAGLDTAVMNRPTWGTIKARVTRRNGQVDPTIAVKWRTQDSTKVRLRQIRAQSVNIESPMQLRLGTTRVIVDIGGKHDSLTVQVVEGIAGLALDSASYQLTPLSQKQVCSWYVVADGGPPILTPNSDSVAYCRQYPHR